MAASVTGQPQTTAETGAKPKTVLKLNTQAEIVEKIIELANKQEELFQLIRTDAAQRVIQRNWIFAGAGTFSIFTTLFSIIIYHRYFRNR